MELLKSTNEHREPNIVGFFILQYAKLRMLELFYNFFENFFDVIKFEDLEMDTDSLYLALAEENLYDCIQPEKRDIWEKMRENDCKHFQGRCKNLVSSLERFAVSIKSMISGTRDLSKRNLDAHKCYVYIAKLIAAMTTEQTNSNLAA